MDFIVDVSAVISVFLISYVILQIMEMRKEIKTELEFLRSEVFELRDKIHSTMTTMIPPEEPAAPNDPDPDPDLVEHQPIPDSIVGEYAFAEMAEMYVKAMDGPIEELPKPMEVIPEPIEETPPPPPKKKGPPPSGRMVVPPKIRFTPKRIIDPDEIRDRTKPNPPPEKAYPPPPQPKIIYPPEQPIPQIKINGYLPDSGMDEQIKDKQMEIFKNRFARDMKDVLDQE